MDLQRASRKTPELSNRIPVSPGVGACHKPVGGAFPKIEPGRRDIKRARQSPGVVDAGAAHPALSDGSRLVCGAVYCGAGPWRGSSTRRVDLARVYLGAEDPLRSSQAICQSLAPGLAPDLAPRLVSCEHCCSQGTARPSSAPAGRRAGIKTEESHRLRRLQSANLEHRSAKTARPGLRGPPGPTKPAQ